MANSFGVACPRAEWILRPLQSANARARTAPASKMRANPCGQEHLRLGVPRDNPVCPSCPGELFQMDSCLMSSSCMDLLDSRPRSSISP